MEGPCWVRRWWTWAWRPRPASLLIGVRKSNDMIAVCGGSGAASLLPCASPSFFPNYKMICFKFFSPLKFPHQISESQFKISLGLMFLKRLFEHYLKYFSHFQLSNLFRNSKFKTIFLIYLLKKYCILVKIISLK